MAVSEPLRRNLTPRRIVAVSDGVRSERGDTLVTEEPLEIRAGGPGQEPGPVAVTMRTPGGDFDLAVGFLFTEGLIQLGDVRRVAYCDNLPGQDQRYNVVSVSLERPFDASRLRRNFFATSSCGVCGKAALDDIEVRCPPVAAGPEVRADVLVGLPDALREAQRVERRRLGHDTRVALGAIAGWTHILRLEKSASETVTRAADVLDRNVRALARVIDSVPS